ncbi:unnamed protein product [Triticum turgidum subsp. durum]|uniref:Uncharacterized protein n=1 Tax=Triticum turgidum subsp. durum TaxID=4567 RepID=A0A9R1Q692_TRITD|nr:unnamed protein product [Triticum turgidum subsp. durum]
MAFAALALWSGGWGLSASSAPWEDASDASFVVDAGGGYDRDEGLEVVHRRLVFEPASAKLADADPVRHGALLRPPELFSSAQDLASRGGLRLCGSQSLQAMVLLRI